MVSQIFRRRIDSPYLHSEGLGVYFVVVLRMKYIPADGVYFVIIHRMKYIPELFLSLKSLSLNDSGDRVEVVPVLKSSSSSSSSSY